MISLRKADGSLPSDDAPLSMINVKIKPRLAELCNLCHVTSSPLFLSLPGKYRVKCAVVCGPRDGWEKRTPARPTARNWGNSCLLPVRSAYQCSILHSPWYPVSAIIKNLDYFINITLSINMAGKKFKLIVDIHSWIALGMPYAGWICYLCTTKDQYEIHHDMSLPHLSWNSVIRHWVVPDCYGAYPVLPDIYIRE